MDVFHFLPENPETLVACFLFELNIKNHEKFIIMKHIVFHGIVFFIGENS